jgi:non-ribosomal peptide synthetase component E (peptide arylation enzyme)
LRKCLAADFDPANEAASRAFLAAQSPPDQSILASLLLTKPPSDPTAIARDTLANLRRKELDARREALTARLRQTGLSPGEVAALQGEVVDIMRQLAEATRSH